MLHPQTFKNHILVMFWQFFFLLRNVGISSVYRNVLKSQLAGAKQNHTEQFKL